MNDFLLNLEVGGGFCAVVLAMVRYHARKPDEDSHEYRHWITGLLVLSVAAWLTGLVSRNEISDRQQQAQDTATTNCEREALREAPVQPVKLDRAGGNEVRNADGTFSLAESVFSTSQRYEATFNCETDSSGNVQGLITYGWNFGGGPNP